MKSFSICDTLPPPSLSALLHRAGGGGEGAGRRGEGRGGSREEVNDPSGKNDGGLGEAVDDAGGRAGCGRELERGQYVG